jgi:hypothetical protein
VQTAKRLVLTLLLCGASVSAQIPDEDWEFEDGYQTQMLYLHSLVNYAYDLEWQSEWEPPTSCSPISTSMSASR